MPAGSLSVRVRPLRIAFLVDPSDKAGLLSAIEANTFLWGAIGNPIIPIYKRTPSKFTSDLGSKLTPEKILSGYLEAFDPDLVIPIGNCENQKFDVGHREILKVDDLLRDFGKTHTSNFGVGFLEIFANLIHQEFKFKRTDNLKVLIPTIPNKYQTFLASVFGQLPAEVENIVKDVYGKNIEIESPDLTLKSFLGLLDPTYLFPRRITSWSLERHPRNDPILFICDANSPQDIIDYVNLRAAGYSVIPIPKQISKNPEVRKFVCEFVESNYQPYQNHPKIFIRPIFQKSRSISKEFVDNLYASLNITVNPDNGEPKLIIRHWYPRLWDAWARTNVGEAVGRDYAYEVDLSISENEERLDLRSHDPKFKLFKGYSGNPRFANDFSFRFYSSVEPMAEIFPEGSRELSSAIGRTGYRSWRFSKSGPVFLAKTEQDLIFLELPRAEPLMLEWLKDKGWKAELSTSGRMAKQLFKQLGGVWGISWLANKGVIELLRDLEKEAGMLSRTLICRLDKIVSSEGLFIDSRRFLEIMLKANAVNLGVKIQCPVCARHNWYDLNVLGYNLQCRFCLSDFDAPIQSSDNLSWTYRAQGPFTSKYAQGSFSVLFVLKFLLGRNSLDNGVTPLFSFTAKKGDIDLESDLTCLYKAAGWEETETKIVHAECKSLNNFQQQDFKRMKVLAESFPGSILIFATLKESLTKSEISGIRAIVNLQRKKQFKRLEFSPVLILTGTELLSSDGAPYCWKNKTGIYQKFAKIRGSLSDLSSVANVTQQLYLGLPDWYEWAAAKRKK